MSQSAAKSTYRSELFNVRTVFFLMSTSAKMNPANMNMNLPRLLQLEPDQLLRLILIPIFGELKTQYFLFISDTWSMSCVKCSHLFTHQRTPLLRSAAYCVFVFQKECYHQVAESPLVDKLCRVLIHPHGEFFFLVSFFCLVVVDKRIIWNRSRA